MKRDSRKSPIDANKVPTRREVRAFDPDGLAPAATIAEFRPDFEGTPRSAWNRSVTDVFVLDFLECNLYVCNDYVKIDAAYLSHFRSLQKQYRRQKMTDVERTALKKQHNRDSRKYLVGTLASQRTTYLHICSYSCFSAAYI